MKTLIIVEEIGDITVSAAIANWSLINILGKELKQVDVLTLDNISKDLYDNWSKGEIILHKKDNLSKIQIFIRKNATIFQTIFQVLSGNNFEQYNRIKNIRSFINKSNSDYKNIILLSGGLGFSPHQAISKIKLRNKTNIIAVFHDPYPSSSYPEPYRGGNYFYEYFKRKNLQKAINKIDYAIFPSKKLYEWYLNDYKLNSVKVKFVPHAVKFKKSTILENKKSTKIITHTGTLLKPRNPLSFLHVFSKLKNYNFSLNFQGPIHPEVFLDIKDYNKNSIQISNERIPYDDALKCLQDSDFLLLVESGAEFSPFLPTKFVDYINIGKPIIVLTPKKSELTRLLGENYPFITTLNDEKGIEKILLNLENDELIKLSLKIINKLKKYFSEDYILKEYLEILSTNNEK